MTVASQPCWPRPLNHSITPHLLNYGQLQERDAQIQRKHEQLQEIVGRLATVTLEGFENLEGKMSSLANAQVRTDERLNTLINVVERHISEGRNRGPHP